MRVVIVNKSDSTGGAAVVSLRLMEALCAAGVDAKMLVAEKLTDDSRVALAGSGLALKRAFLAERLKIFLANGFDRGTLFKIDTASDGVDIASHPWVREADVVCLNWVNQGMLSWKGIEKLLKAGKPVVWTMHDMWCMTGICHHAGECEGFCRECGNCRLLGRLGSANDLSHKIWMKKNSFYHRYPSLRFVAVSNWLRHRAEESTLLGGRRVEVIPNAFPFDEETAATLAAAKRRGDGKKRIVMGAARLDDPIKGLDTLREATVVLRKRNPQLADRLELHTFGDVRNPETLEGFGIPVVLLGRISGRDKLSEVYKSADIVVSSSHYETLPGTLVEGQAWGCVPVAFDHGGQSDIIDHKSTGWLSPYDRDASRRAESLAEGLAWAAEQGSDIISRMREEAKSRFSSQAVAARYIALFRELLS